LLLIAYTIMLLSIYNRTGVTKVCSSSWINNSFVWQYIYITYLTPTMSCLKSWSMTTREKSTKPWRENTRVERSPTNSWHNHKNTHTYSLPLSASDLWCYVAAGNLSRSHRLHTKAMVTTMTRLRFVRHLTPIRLHSTALRPFVDLHHDRAVALRPK